jgi:hypothetical protein
MDSDLGLGNANPVGRLKRAKLEAGIMTCRLHHEIFDSSYKVSKRLITQSGTACSNSPGPVHLHLSNPKSPFAEKGSV